jgi:hypothetical protein
VPHSLVSAITTNSPKETNGVKRFFLHAVGVLIKSLPLFPPLDVELGGRVNKRRMDGGRR